MTSDTTSVDIRVAAPIAIVLALAFNGAAAWAYTTNADLERTHQTLATTTGTLDTTKSTLADTSETLTASNRLIKIGNKEIDRINASSDAIKAANEASELELRKMVSTCGSQGRQRSGNPRE